MSNLDGKLVSEAAKIEKLVHINLPLEVILAIEDYMTNDRYGRHHKKKTTAMTELLRVGLWFARNRTRFETIFHDPALMEELQSQLKEGGLVDYVERMKDAEFRIVWDIFRTEAKSRKMI